jgi:hypothetical protein
MIGGVEPALGRAPDGKGALIDAPPAGRPFRKNANSTGANALNASAS